MSSPYRNSCESDITILKNLLKKVVQDVQALSFRQLHHKAQFVQIQDDLKMVKDEYTKSKKSSHASSFKVDNYFGEQSFIINEYYQPPPRRARKERKENTKEVRVDLPYFHGKENVEAYLD